MHIFGRWVRIRFRITTPLNTATYPFGMFRLSLVNPKFITTATTTPLAYIVANAPG